MTDGCRVLLIKRPRTLPSGKRVYYWVLRWVGTDGKEFSESLGRTDEVTKTDAKKSRDEKQTAIGSGKAPRNRPPKRTLAGFCDELISSLRGDLRGTTLAEYRIAADHAIAAIGADLDIGRIDWRHTGAIKARLEHRSRATLRKTLVTLRAMFYRGVERGLLASNPFSNVDLPPIDAKPARIFTRRDIAAMVEAAENLWWKAFVRLLADTGLRVAEGLHLRWEDLDFQGGTVKVRGHRHGVFAVGGVEYPILAWSVKAKASTRTVPLSEEAVAALQRMKLAGDGSAYVFLDFGRLRQLRGHLDASGGLPAMYDLVPNLLRDFKVLQERVRELEAKARKVAAAKVEWPVGTIHDLRKSWCTFMADKLPLHVLREMAGHQDIATTVRFYQRTTADDAAKVRKALAAG